MFTAPAQIDVHYVVLTQQKRSVILPSPAGKGISFDIGPTVLVGHLFVPVRNTLAEMNLQFSVSVRGFAPNSFHFSPFDPDLWM
jgi:hypothetical protein